jgi:SAM-dependent methyltransferase
MSESMINRQFGEDILRRNPTDERIIRGVGYANLDESLDASNPFVRNQYDFERGFYKGDFEFQSPLTGEVLRDTPEAYGRHRAVTALLDRLEGAPSATVLDLGCGTLDVARTLPGSEFGRVKLLNADISGPWSSGDGLSALERGTDKLLTATDLDEEAIFNLQYDFNKSEWAFNGEVLDHVVSNMALHHIHPDLKAHMLDAMYASLKNGGSLIFTDVFNKDDTGVRFTQAGLRGPEECGGYLINISEFIDLARRAGFQVDVNAQTLLEESRNHQVDEELDRGLGDIHSTMAINKAIWFMELTK